MEASAIKEIHTVERRAMNIEGCLELRKFGWRLALERCDDKVECGSEFEATFLKSGSSFLLFMTVRPSLAFPIQGHLSWLINLALCISNGMIHGIFGFLTASTCRHVASC